VIVSHIELLLNYSNRFYKRQFITRKAVNNDLLAALENILSDYFNNETGLTKGLPTVQYLAEQLTVSPHYLSDMLRSLTGQNAQQHIHQKLIEKAKEMLSTTNLSVAEVAYQLGFEHPQSFNKLFKRKTNQSPLAFRQLFN
jgi:AraC family transcriptional activator of pobA